MKILHIISGLGPGGAQVVLKRILESDKKNSHFVVSMMDEGIYGSKIKQLNIPIFTLDFPKGKIKFKGLYKLYKLIKKEQPYVVQTWMYHADLVGGIIARLAGIKNVFWNVRNSTFTIKTQSLNTMIVARLCGFLSKIIPKKIIINSYEGRKFHYDLGYKKDMYVINNGYLERNYIQKQNKNNKFFFGMLARWDPQKDYNNFLESIAELKKNNEFIEINKNTEIKFILAGHRIDNSNTKIKKIIKDHNLEDITQLVGDYSEDKVDNFYDLIDVHVLSSRSEGFPNVVAESMRYGVPNISTKVGDADRIIGETGWIVEPRSKSALAKAFLEALKLHKKDKNKWEMLKINASKRINENYNIFKMIDSFNNLWSENLLKNKVTKIFHIISGLGSGGAQAVLARLVKNEKKYNHTIISFMDFGIYESYFKEIDVKLIKLDMEKGKFSLKGFVKLCKIIKENKPDVIQTWMYHADFIGGLVGKFYKTKKIFWNIRNSNLKTEWASYSTIVISRFCAFLSNLIPTSIISCSKKSKDVHISLGYNKNKIKVINNGYDTQEMFFINKKNDNVFKIGMLARWDPQKDYKNLAKSLNEFQKLTNRNWQLYLAGDRIDENNHKLTKIFYNSQFKDKIIYEGMITDIKSFFEKIDLHVLSSAGNEGFPNVVAESMSYGVPCISTDVGDSSLIIDKYGWLVPVKSPKDLANKIYDASEEYFSNFENWERRRKDSRQHVISNYTLSKMVNNYTKVWEN